MDWSDEGIVLSARKHGESAALVQLLTKSHGRHAGLVRGGASKKNFGVYQPGNVVAACWRARLTEHLGGLTGELVRSYAAQVLNDADRLAGLSAACAVAEASLPERQPHPTVFAGIRAVLDSLAGEVAWPAVYVRWEIGLLADLGFGLDLRRCAATGETEDLIYVSPRSGRAVSRTSGAQYHDRLLPLPGFLVGRTECSADDVVEGLRLAGHFMRRHVFAPQNRDLPAARARLHERLCRQADADRNARNYPTSSGKRRQ